ncbi:MAG TPA: hypothetical protein DCL41_11330 [Bdellovibrionales bacterium]|nr:hypothetical protein [Pseudobdellovibrionaceae bacterium]HAG92459.1 hypothetical protein [Bdellovibrionales bacterium]|tara:strand:- start:311 stop:697 length:387 start_codon:yes stop_codon:yes gene_type:complete
MKWKVILILALNFQGVALGCANHPCRLKKGGAEMGSVTGTQENMEKVLVAKHDGSKQCDKKSGTSLDVMVKDLGEIKVYDQFKAQDDLMRIQVCGAPTGMHNVYEISKSDLKKATQVGFTLWKGSKKK